MCSTSRGIVLHLTGSSKVRYIKTPAADMDQRRCSKHGVHTQAPVLEYELKLPKTHSCMYTQGCGKTKDFVTSVTDEINKKAIFSILKLFSCLLAQLSPLLAFVLARKILRI